jgi:hypothetical protein
MCSPSRILLSLVGCAERYNTRPTQLGELNNDLALNDGRRLKIKLETSDGRIVEVTQPVVVYVTTDDGQEHTFCSLLRATYDEGALEIKHDCGPSARLAGREIAKVEVEEY